MAEFGRELMAERERLGVSIASLCSETKVSARHVQALEDGDYLALPGGVFRRGIVRAYLKALRLEEESWMPRFQQSVEQKALETGAPLEADDIAWATFAKNVKKNRGTLRSRNGLRWAGVLLLLLVVAGGAWAVWHFVLRSRLSH